MKWWLFPIFGLLACAGFCVAPAGVVAESMFVAIGAISLVAVIAGICFHRPAALRGWVFIAAGSALWVAGDAAFLVIARAQGAVPIVSFADAIYLVGYPIFAVGLYLLVHQGWRRGDRAHVINSAIVMIAFSLVLWVFVIYPKYGELSKAGGITSVTYCMMDVFMLGFLIHFLGATQWQSMTFRFLTAAVVLLLVSDIASNFVSVGGVADRLVDVGYLAYYVLVGTAAVHPSMGYLTAPIPHNPETTIAASFNFPTVLVVTVAALTPPAVMAVLLVRGEPATTWGWAVTVSATTLVCLVLVRVSELLRLLQRQTLTLRGVAETDLLTGLVNRRGLERWAASTRSLTFLLLDIDRFKEVNDTFGHRVGDDVLRAVADRLVRTVGTRGVVGRISADVFVVAIDAELSVALKLADDVHDALRAPVAVRRATLLVEVSIGIARSGTDAGKEDPEQLGQRAYLAMESAKTVQPRTAVYDSTMERDDSDRLVMLSELTTAIVEHQLEVYYQLQVELSSMRAVSVEALLRWNHPTLGLIGPDAFLPIAERTGLIRPLLDFVLDEVTAHRLAWRRDGLDLEVSVNISTRNLLDTTLVNQIRRALDNGMRPDALTLEITETSSMTDPPVAIATLAELRKLGVTLAIDDYGTGYSSLAYLQNLPVQHLKIDKSFVTDMTKVPAHRVIVSSTIDLARTLGLTITAEGVEDRATLLELRSLRCDFAQGYYIGRPAPAADIAASIAKFDAEVKEYAKTL